jgi:hypothetical protein
MSEEPQLSPPAKALADVMGLRFDGKDRFTGALMYMGEGGLVSAQELEADAAEIVRAAQ